MTKRLILRPLQISDYKSWKLAYLKLSKERKSLWDITQKESHEVSRSQFRKLLRDQNSSFKKDQNYFWGIFSKQGRYLGGVALQEVTRSIYQTGILGYRLLHPYWNKGYAREALQALIPWIFSELKLHRLEAYVEPKNIASIKLLKDLGAQREALLKKRIYARDQWQTVWLFSFSSENFDFYVHLDTSEEF